MRRHFFPICLAAALAAVSAAAQDRANIDEWLSRGGVINGITESRIKLDVPPTRRYAYVVGNSDYRTAIDLPNAVSDADLMADYLRDQGFRVMQFRDLDKRGFEALLRQALFDITEDTEVVFYYAGHGIQIGRRNYLLPTDANLETAADLAFETVTLDTLVTILAARSRLQIVILDSCRDNPFAENTVAGGLSVDPLSTGNGFSPMSAPVNTLMAYATAPGQVAFDGEGSNSPYTQSFVSHARARPGDPITTVLERVRMSVYEATGGWQIPWESSTLVEQFRLTEAGIARTPVATAPVNPQEARTRGLQLVTSTLVTDIAPTTTAEPSDHTLRAPLERRVNLGEALKDIVGTLPDTTVTIDGTPITGRLTYTDKDGIIRDYAAQPLDGTQVATLALETTVDQSGPRAALEDHVIRESFRIGIANEGNREARLILVEMTPDPCDYHAGDHLDPEGTSIARYANEIEPEIALAACQEAIAREPDNGRFHYQLSRAQIALKDFEAAKVSLNRSRDLGHTRAWHGLGRLLATEELTTSGLSNKIAPKPALDNYLEGVQRGDPYAYYALGRNLLRFGASQDQQQQGFELLSRALELGHTFAMNELGYFFLDKKAKYYSPERALRYLNESAAREDIYGYYNLGLVFDRGLGETPKDPAKAREWYLKAAAGGHPVAPRKLASFLEKGKLGAKDSAAALKWYDEGLSRGDALAGAGGAWLIATAGLPDYDLAQAAIRAAKTAVLTNKKARADAEDLLGQVPDDWLNAASQNLMNELGAELTADGKFGAGSQTALEAIMTEDGVLRSFNTPRERLIYLAGIYWKRSRFRVDLY